MKKTLARLLALSIMVLCASCGGTPADEQTDTSPASGQTSTAPVNDTGTVYTITDYYDANGGYSALGSALDEENGEKVLTVQSGDTLVVGGHSYSVTAESLTIPFYTQPSLDEVLAWWTEYCQSRIERGEAAEVR